MPSIRSLAISALLTTAALAAPARETKRDTNTPKPEPTTIMPPSGSDEEFVQWVGAVMKAYPDVEVETFPSEPTKTIVHKAGVAQTVATDSALPTALLQPWTTRCPDGYFYEAGGCHKELSDEQVKCNLSWMKSPTPGPYPCGPTPPPVPKFPDWCKDAGPEALIYCPSEAEASVLESVMRHLYTPAPTTPQTTTKPTEKADVITERDEGREPTSTVSYLTIEHPIMPTGSIDWKGTVTISNYRTEVVVPGTVTIPYEPTSTADN